MGGGRMVFRAPRCFARGIVVASRTMQTPHPLDSSADLAFRRASALEAAGRSEEAAALYRGLLAMHPGHADALNALALIEKRRGKTRKAEALLRKAVAAPPG